MLKPRLHDTTGCQTRCQTDLTTGCIVYTAGCQTGLYNRFDNRLNEQLLVQHGCQTVERTVAVRSTHGWFDNRFGCLFTQYSRLSKRLYNHFDNRLYPVNGVLITAC